MHFTVEWRGHHPEHNPFGTVSYRSRNFETSEKAHKYADLKAALPDTKDVTVWYHEKVYEYDD